MRYVQQPYRPGHEGYVSDFTAFMGHFLEEHPEVLEDQHKGWYRFWDQHVDLDELKKAGFDTVPLKGYGYFGSDSQQDAGDTAWDSRYVFAGKK